MAGGVSEALSVLSAAIVPKGPSFVRRPEFSQELVREAQFNRNLANLTSCRCHETYFRGNKCGSYCHVFCLAVLLSVSQHTEPLALFHAAIQRACYSMVGCSIRDAIRKQAVSFASARWICCDCGAKANRARRI